MTNFINMKALTLNPKFIELSSSDLTPRQIYVALIKSQVFNPNTGQPYSYPTVLKYLKFLNNNAPLFAPPSTSSLNSKFVKRGFSSVALNPNIQIFGRSCKCFTLSDGATLVKTTFIIKGNVNINENFFNYLVSFVSKAFCGFKFKALLVHVNDKRRISYGPALFTDSNNSDILFNH